MAYMHQLKDTVREDEKHNPTIPCVYKYKDIHRLKANREKCTMLTLIQKSIALSSYVNFKQRRLQSKESYQDKERYYIMIKVSILQEDITNLNTSTL